MKIYDDAELTREIKESDKIDLGIVKAGTVITKTMYIKNDADAVLHNFEYTIPNAKSDRITVVDFPTLIQANDVKPFTIKWEPDQDYKQALKTSLEINAEEVYI